MKELKKINDEVRITIKIGEVVWREDWHKKLSDEDIYRLEDVMDEFGELDEADAIKKGDE